jgi:DNA-directed RNA polymerase I subunit RPA2
MYSSKGIAMRCVRKDQSSITVTLHYLNDGGATLKFVLRKQEFLLPVVLVAKAMVEISDKELYSRILQGDTNNTFLSSRLGLYSNNFQIFFIFLMVNIECNVYYLSELLLRDAKNYGLYSKNEYSAYLGSHFRNFLPISERCSDQEAGEMLIQRLFRFLILIYFTTLFHV